MCEREINMHFINSNVIYSVILNPGQLRLRGISYTPRKSSGRLVHFNVRNGKRITSELSKNYLFYYFMIHCTSQRNPINKHLTSSVCYLYCVANLPIMESDTVPMNAFLPIIHLPCLPLISATTRYCQSTTLTCIVVFECRLRLPFCLI